jgi:hypothetical protein
MATPGRDEGLDKLEALIALLDAAGERIENGAERLESASDDLREAVGGLRDDERRLDDVLAERYQDAGTTLTRSIEGLANASEAENDPLVARVNALAEAAAHLQETVEHGLETVVLAARDLETRESTRSVETLSTQLELLRGHVTELTEEMRKLYDFEKTLEANKDALEASAHMKTVMIAMIVVLSVIAVVVAVLTLGAAASVWIVAATVAATAIALVVGVVVEAPVLMASALELLRLMGFKESAEALEDLIDSEWFQVLAAVVAIVAALAVAVTTLGSAASVAAAVLALSVPLMIARTVVDSVARLLSALNPFD